MMSWRVFLARIGVAALVGGSALTLAVFVGMRLATADPGGPTRDALTYAGVLREPDGGLPVSSRPATLTFSFSNVGGSSCSPPPVTATIAAGGAFTVVVPLGPCASFFDGADVTYTVAEGGVPLTPDGGVAVTPVPYARFADQVGIANDCPAGYAKSADVGDAPFTVCRRTLGGGRLDELVKVGFGASAFWADRYEASVWDNAATTGMRLFRNFDSTSADFPKSGQWRNPGRTSTVRSPLQTPPAYAWSIRGVMPSSTMTWFQAQEACAASGKALPTRDEWLRAAQGTEDPGDVPWTDGSCRNTGGVLGNVPRDTGLGMLCRSGWGVQDMIGNVAEWTDEWYANAGTSTAIVNDPISPSPWPTGYGDGQDRTWNVGSYVERASGTGGGMPAAAIRGGGWNDGVNAGVFAFMLDFGPSVSRVYLGFRCVVRR